MGNAWVRIGDEAQAARWWSEAIATHRESAHELGEHLELCSPAMQERFTRDMRGVPLSKQYKVPRR